MILNLYNKVAIGFALAQHMNSLLFTIVLIALLCGVLIVLGREYEERFPHNCDYLHGGQTSTLVQQLRVGAFLALDSATDMIWPGSREKAIHLKRVRKTKQELLNEK